MDQFHCTVQDGIRYYGRHLLVEVWGGKKLDDAKLVKQALLDAVVACGANLLNLYVHDFGEGSGVTGVAVLSESHISIHTWPETGYAALDVYTCGSCDPKNCLPVFQEAFSPETISVDEKRRGAEYVGQGS
jgi:S-adenosylmethionine decarboxylase